MGKVTHAPLLQLALFSTRQKAQFLQCQGNAIRVRVFQQGFSTFGYTRCSFHNFVYCALYELARGKLVVEGIEAGVREIQHSDDGTIRLQSVMLN
jgi:hypothetical protein